MRSGFTLVRHGTDLGEWMCGYQLAKDGVLCPMFDLHKSHIAPLRTADDYENLLCDCASQILVALGPAKDSLIPAPSPSAR